MLQPIGIEGEQHAGFVTRRLMDLRLDMEKTMPGGRIRILSALVIFDVCNALGLTPAERVQVLGSANALRIERLINTPVGKAKP